MLISYQHIKSEHRDVVRSLNNRGHIAYIVYLMMKRYPFPHIQEECQRLGLSSDSVENYQIFFNEAIFPMLQKHEIEGYYKQYKRGRERSILTFAKTFRNNENHRISFCEFAVKVGIDSLFMQEFADYYKMQANVPISMNTGQPVIQIEKVPDITSILETKYRFVIDSMIVDGHPPKSIRAFLEEKYDELFDERAIEQYGKTFFRVKRRDIERMVEDLLAEKDGLTRDIRSIQQNHTLTLGQKSASIGKIKSRVRNINDQITRLTEQHSHAVYNEAILDYTMMREMLSGMYVRTVQRFNQTYHRTEDEAVPILKDLYGIVDKMQRSIISINDKIKENSKKTIQEEMLQVVMPTLERLEEEERHMREQYSELIADNEAEPIEILGMDE